MTLPESIKMNCRQATALVQKKAEGKITFSERVGLFVHLSYCSLCKLFFEQSKFLDEQVSAQSKHFKHHLSDASRKRIEDKLKEQLNNSN